MANKPTADQPQRHRALGWVAHPFTRKWGRMGANFFEILENAESREFFKTPEMRMGASDSE